MTAWRGVLGMLAGGAAALLSGCGLSGDDGRSAEARYRMTVEVETPKGVRSGSSVWSRGISRSIGPITPYNASFKAEAAAVELPGGRMLFLLVKGQEGMVDAYFPDLAVYGENGANDRVAHVRNIGNQVGAKVTLPCTPDAVAPFLASHKNVDDLTLYCPMLVTFQDVNDPKSVQRVGPANFETIFGLGVRLKRITVEVTDEPVTSGIQDRLGWLGEHPEPSLDPSHGPKDFSLPASLHHGDFRLGTKS